MTTRERVIRQRNKRLNYKRNISGKIYINLEID